MTTIESLTEFVIRERDCARTANELGQWMCDESLADRGEAVLGLTFTKRSGPHLIFTCRENQSRFRAGSRLELDNGALRIHCTLIDLRNQGCLLELRPDRKVGNLREGPWAARESDVDLSGLIVQCLRKLQPGVPGWQLCRILAGEDVPTTEPATCPTAAKHLQDLLSEVTIPVDESQREALLRCLELPRLLAVQGPPGTGKTLILALLAESLTRMGKRVVVLAPTHQAVNNALSTLHHLFSDRKVVKIGDELRRESLAADIPCQLFRTTMDELPLTLATNAVIGMTFVSGLHHLVLRRGGLSPNVTIIDEAGQLPLSQGICAGLMGAGATFLFGDDAQMPPVFPSEMKDDRRATSLFARVRQVRPSSVMALRTTYRLNGELCQAIGETFYRDSGVTLQSDPLAAGRVFRTSSSDDMSPMVRKILHDGASLVWHHTVNTRCRQINREEADLFASLVAACVKNGLPASALAVVTPFRRQAALIRNRIQELLPDHDSRLPIVDTVERVQGLTVELVCVSMTASDPEYAASLAPFLFSPNRLNVAVSRARSKVVIAMSPAILNAIPPEYEGLLSLYQCRRLLSMASISTAV